MVSRPRRRAAMAKVIGIGRGRRDVAGGGEAGGRERRTSRFPCSKRIAGLDAEGIVWPVVRPVCCQVGGADPAAVGAVGGVFEVICDRAGWRRWRWWRSCRWWWHSERWARWRRSW